MHIAVLFVLGVLCWITGTPQLHRLHIGSPLVRGRTILSQPSPPPSLADEGLAMSVSFGGIETVDTASPKMWTKTLVPQRSCLKILSRTLDSEEKRTRRPRSASVSSLPLVSPPRRIVERWTRMDLAQ